MAKTKPRVLLVELTEKQFMALATAVDVFDIECDDQLGSLDPADKNDHKYIKEWSESKESLNNGWVAIRNAWHKAGAV
jgi:hypothetical protein